MNSKKIVRKNKKVMLVSMIFFIILLVGGIFLELVDSRLLPNNKALVALSFFPLGIAVSSYIKLQTIKKYPQKMKDFIINENDERLIALRNQADARAFKIMQALLFFLYMGYTLMFPEDIFKTVGWWLLMFLLLASFVLQGMTSAKSMEKDGGTNNEAGLKNK